MLSRNLKMLYPVVMLMVLTVASCKKETTETDDPNIIYKASPKTITIVPSFSAFDTLDINGDGLGEMGISINNMGGDTGTVMFTTYTQFSSFVLEDIVPFPVVKSLAKDEAIPLSSSAYMASGYLTFKASGFRKGLISGDGYVGFRFTTGSAYNYAWMRVGLNSSLTELTIYEYAYNAIPGTAIKAGAK